MTESVRSSPPHAADVRRMFDRIVPRYDFLNRVMSFGMDRRWRRLAAAAAEPVGATALDLGTGTGDLAHELRRQGAARVVGADFSIEMLNAANARASRKDQPTWVQADGLRLPFADASFDCLTNAFVLRNLSDLVGGLVEMTRVLKPGGRLVCLDMTQPPPGPYGALYRAYFWHVMPPVAGWLSGDPEAYRYLPNSLAGFPGASALAEILDGIGLASVGVTRLGGGTVALHCARKA